MSIKRKKEDKNEGQNRKIAFFSVHVGILPFTFSFSTIGLFCSIQYKQII